MDCQEPAESLASGVAAMSLEARDVMDALDWEMPPGLAAMAVSGDSAGCDGARSIAAADGGNGGAASALSASALSASALRASALEASALSASALNEAGAAGASDGKAICDEDGGDGPAQGGGGEAAGKPKRKLEDDEEMVSHISDKHLKYDTSGQSVWQDEFMEEEHRFKPAIRVYSPTVILLHAAVQ
eukprot:TRINITY_DN3652_c0_g1_i2.p2 TRINITY_DN3652_c0_g1~~TRINITY_DN3652_c0_g1_i2.p2  ORF type:complete len:188 (-),score=60.93 TRINITY_DN3652_c0_g1_i2:434-997(-)